MKTPELTIEFLAALGSFIPCRLHTFLHGDEKDYRPDDGMPNNKTAEAILVHEHIHYLQTCMTGYGQTTWNLYRQSIGMVLNMWKNAMSKQKNKRIPLGYHAQNGKKELAFAVYLSALFKEGTKLNQLRDATTFINLSDAGLLLNRQEWQINPVITLGTNSYRLRGRDIIESHAKHLEALYSRLINNIPMTKTVDPQKLPTEYWVAHMWFIQEVGPQRGIEFPVICDLALQTTYCDPPKSEKEWRDSHPAWRFVKLTNALKANLVPAFTSPDDIVCNYPEYSRKLLEYCDFTPLSDVFNKALAWYESGSNIMGLQKKMHDPMLFRLGVPWCGANPFLVMSTWIDIKSKFTSPLIQVGPYLSLTPVESELPPIDSKEMENLYIEFVGELHLHAFVMQILGFISQYSTDVEEMQCGFGYFGIRQGCKYQRSCNCPGRFVPSKGFPVTMKYISKDKLEGCDFEMLLMALDIDVDEVECNFSKHQLPNMDELQTSLK